MEETCSNKKEQILPWGIYCEVGSFSNDHTTLLFTDIKGGKKKEVLPLAWIVLSLSSSFPFLPPHTWALIALFASTVPEERLY